MLRRTILLSATASAAQIAFANSAISPLTKMTVGLTLPKSGSQSEIAKDLEAGYRLGFLESPAFSIKVMDDEAKPAKVIENLRTLAGDSSVFVFSGIVGTPHAEAAIPVARQLGIPVVGIRSGARSLRDGLPGVYHLRSSYEDEIDKAVAMCVGSGIPAMAILYSNDTFGIPLQKYFEKRLSESGVKLLVSEPVERTGANLADATRKVSNRIKASGAACGVSLLLITATMTTAAKMLRANSILMPIFAMSFTGVRSVASEKSVDLAGLGYVSAFPLPRASGLRSAVAFRKAATANGREDLIPSLTAYEGYFYASVIARAASLGREGFIRQLTAGFQLFDDHIKFEQGGLSPMVGYQYLSIARKSTFNGHLYS